MNIIIVGLSRGCLTETHIVLSKTDPIQEVTVEETKGTSLTLESDLNEEIQHVKKSDL